MPIYEYECQSCKEVIEKWQSFSDKPLTTCPECSGTLKKIISQSSFQLKGGGWYADGYSGPSNKKGCAPSGSDSSSAGSCSKESASCACN